MADDGERRLCVAGDTPHVDRRVADFLRREAKSDLEQASRHFAERLGLAIKQVSIRDPSSRWGSCSTTGVLSYSWRLILAPPYVLDYLAAHEVAHLVEMNHSPRFWRLVDRLCPNVQRAKAWLDAHGTRVASLRSAACARIAGTSGQRPEPCAALTGDPRKRSRHEPESAKRLSGDIML